MHKIELPKILSWIKKEKERNIVTDYDQDDAARMSCGTLKLGKYKSKKKHEMLTAIEEILNNPNHE